MSILPFTNTPNTRAPNTRTCLISIFTTKAHIYTYTYNQYIYRYIQYCNKHSCHTSPIYYCYYKYFTTHTTCHHHSSFPFHTSPTKNSSLSLEPWVAPTRSGSKPPSWMTRWSSSSWCGYTARRRRSRLCCRWNGASVNGGQN